MAKNLCASIIEGLGLAVWSCDQGADGEDIVEGAFCDEGIGGGSGGIGRGGEVFYEDAEAFANKVIRELILFDDAAGIGLTIIADGLVDGVGKAFLKQGVDVSEAEDT